MGRKTDILPIISLVLITLMLIAVPSFAFFEEFGSGGEDFFTGGNDGGAEDFFDGVGEGGSDFFDGVGDGGDDFFDGIGAGGDDFFDGVGDGDNFFDSADEFEGGAIDEDEDEFDGVHDDIPGEDDPVDFPLPPDTDNPIDFPPESANVLLTITDSPDPVRPGNAITYTITYHNVGYSNAADVTLSFSRDQSTTHYSGPTLWNAGTVGPNEQGSMTVVVTAASNLADGTILTANAYLNYVDTAKSESHDISATAETTITNQVVPPPVGANIVASVTDTPDPVKAGQALKYTLTLTNNGDRAAQNVTLRRICDKNLVSECNENTTIYTSIAAGQTKTLVYNEAVKANTANNTLLSTTFRIQYYDPAPAAIEGVLVTANTRVNNCGTTPGPEPSPPEKSDQDVSLKIVSTSFPFTTSGGSFPVYLTVENNGAERLNDVSIAIVSQELALRSGIGPFDLGKGDTATRMLMFEFPEGIQEGIYPLRFTISSNGQMRRVVYREIEIVSTPE